jgi:hypothetical protein
MGSQVELVGVFLHIVLADPFSNLSIAVHA